MSTHVPVLELPKAKLLSAEIEGIKRRSRSRIIALLAMAIITITFYEWLLIQLPRLFR